MTTPFDRSFVRAVMLIPFWSLIAVAQAGSPTDLLHHLLRVMIPIRLGP